MTKNKRLVTVLYKLAEDEESLTGDRLKAAELLCRVTGSWHRANRCRPSQGVQRSLRPWTKRFRALTWNRHVICCLKGIRVVGP